MNSMTNDIHYVVFLFLVTGLLILYFDVKGYDMAGMTREKKTARVLGWVNVSLGIFMFVVNWIYQTGL